MASAGSVGRRPGQRRAAGGERAIAERRVGGNPSLDRARDVEHVERRHPLARLLQLERGHERYARSAAAPTASRSCSRSSSARCFCFGERRRQQVAALRRAAARPRAAAAGTRVRRGRARRRRRNDRPRAACGVPTNTRPCRRRGGSCVSVSSRGVSTSRTSRSETGPTSAERRELAQHAQDARRLPQHPRRQIAEHPQPLAPPPSRVREPWPRAHFADERERERAEVIELLEVALDGRDARRFRFVRRQLVEPPLVLLAQAAEPPFPPILMADHRRFDEQLLPPPGRAQRARHHAAALAFGRRRPSLVLRLRIDRAIGRRQHRTRDLVGRRGPAVRRRLTAGRHLRQRQVLGEPPGRQLLVRAGQQREKRPSRRIGAARAAIEPGGNPGALQRVFEQPEVGVRRAEHDGHLIERHAARGLRHDAPRNLHAFAPFARRREEDDRLVRGPLRHGLARKQVPLKAGEGIVAAARRLAAGETECLQRVGRPQVALGNRREDGVGGPRQHAHEPALRVVRDRHVEQDDGRIPQGRRIAFEDGGGRGQHRGAVGGAGPSEFLADAGQQVREVGAGLFDRQQVGGSDTGESKLGERLRQRARKPGKMSDRREVREAARRRRGKRGAGRDCFGAEAAGRARTVAGERRQGQARGQLGEAHTRDAEQSAPFPRDGECQFVRGRARRPDNQGAVAGPHLCEPRARRVDAPLGGSRADETECRSHA